MSFISELEQYEMYASLGLMVVAAVSLVYIGSKRGLKSFADAKRAPETLTATDAAQFPVSGSIALFTMYVLVKYIPSAYVGLLLGFYLTIFAVFALNYFVRPYLGANILIGFASLLMGFLYFYTDKHWMITNVFGISISVVAIQSMVVGSFSTGAILLSGLFFYDIFWVFGTDVMVSVATNIDGPIKILFPQHPISWKTDRMSLLGLGDIVVPGFYIAMICVFSTIGREKMRLRNQSQVANPKPSEQGEERKEGKPRASNIYFIVAMVAYTLSLVNTMFVMMFFQHAQPALLYIVPWLLVTTVLTAAIKGELSMLWEFDVSLLFDTDAKEVVPEGAKVIASPTAPNSEGEEDSLLWVIKDFFGLVKEAEAGKEGTSKQKQE